MSRLIIIFAAFILFALGPLPISARQVGFEGAISLISENTSLMNDSLAHYSPHHRFSLGLRHIRLKQDTSEVYSGFAQAAILLQRWNREDVQANLYAYGGAGGLTFRDENGMAYLSGAQIDAEDRRFYGLFRFTTLLSDKMQDYYNYRGRLGVAPYIANYDELNAWVMLQYDYRPGQLAEHRATPFVRLFYKSILLELGSSTRGDWMINFVTKI